DLAVLDDHEGVQLRVRDVADREVDRMVPGERGERLGATLVRVGERDRALLAERLDIEGATGTSVLDAAGDLGRAGAAVRAAPVLVTLLLGPDLGAAGGTLRRHDEGALSAVAQRLDRTEDLGDHVPGLAQHDRVADEHALALDVELVVQG